MQIGAKSKFGRRRIGTDRRTSLPAYHQLYVLLEQKIKDGVFPNLSLLPSENRLADEYKVSRVTVRRALALLEENGYVTRRHGKGTFVTARPAEARVAAPIRGPLDSLMAAGIKTHGKLLLWETVPAPEDIARQLNQPVGSKVLLVRRLRAVHGMPFSYTSIYLPEHIGCLLSQRAAKQRLIIELLDETPYKPATADHSLTATLAQDPVAEYLNVPVGSPLLHMQGVLFDARKRPIYVQDSLYVPSNYQYHVRLRRGMGSPRSEWRFLS